MHHQKSPTKECPVMTSIFKKLYFKYTRSLAPIAPGNSKPFLNSLRNSEPFLIKAIEYSKTFNHFVDTQSKREMVMHEIRNDWHQYIKIAGGSQKAAKFLSYYFWLQQTTFNISNEIKSLHPAMAEKDRTVIINSAVLSHLIIYISLLDV